MTLIHWIEVAIVVRGLAVVLGIFRKVPLSWIIWATVYEVFEFALLACHFRGWTGPDGWYVRFYVVQQIVSAALMCNLIRYTVKPPAFLVAACATVATVISAGVAIIFMFESNPIEPTMLICGTVTLALGLCAAVTALVAFDWYQGILAAYLLLYASFLVLGNEFLKSASLGKSISVMEVAVFASWSVVWISRRKRGNVGLD